MLVRVQVDDVFLPLPDDILANLQEKSEQFEGLFDQLPSWQETASLKGEALQALLREDAFRARFRNDVEGEFQGFRLFKGDWDGVSVLTASAAGLQRLRQHCGNAWQ